MRSTAEVTDLEKNLKISLLCPLPNINKIDTHIKLLKINMESQTRGTWVAQSVKHLTLDIGVVGSIPTLGVEIP